MPTRPTLPQGLESSFTGDSGQRNLYIYWSCPDPNQASREVAQEEGTLTIHASKGDLRSRPFSQTIRKACEAAPPLDLINQFLVHQGLVVQHDHDPGPIEPLQGFPRRLSVEIHYPSSWADWELSTNTLTVTQTVEEGDSSQQPSSATPSVELGPEVPIVLSALPDPNVSRGVAIYAIDEPAESRDLTIGVQFHNVPTPPHSGSGADRYDTDQVFHIPRPRVDERIHRPIHVLWGVSGSISQDQATFLSDLARRAPLVHSEGSTFNASPGTDRSAHGLLMDFARHAGHAADWVFVPITPDGRSPDAWPIGAHEGEDTAGVHYARVALVPDPRVGQRRTAQWLDYANDLDAWSYAAARWLDAGEPTYPAVTWLNLISEQQAGTSRVQAFFRPNDAHDINDRRADTGMSIGVPSVPTWNRMTAHLAREPARDNQDGPSSLSHVLTASQTGADPMFQLSLDLDESLPDWGASPRRSGGNQHWRVLTSPPQTPFREQRLQLQLRGGRQPAALRNQHYRPHRLPGHQAAPNRRAPNHLRRIVDEATGIAWRLPLPDTPGLRRRHGRLPHPPGAHPNGPRRQRNLAMLRSDRRPLHLPMRAAASTARRRARLMRAGILVAAAAALDAGAQPEAIKALHFRGAIIGPESRTALISRNSAQKPRSYRIGDGPLPGTRITAIHRDHAVIAYQGGSHRLDSPLQPQPSAVRNTPRPKGRAGFQQAGRPPPPFRDC